MSHDKDPYHHTNPPTELKSVVLGRQASKKKKSTQSDEILPNCPISESSLKALGFTYRGGHLEAWERDDIEVWEANGYCNGWIIEALDQAGVTARFATIGELDKFWRASKQPPLLKS